MSSRSVTGGERFAFADGGATATLASPHATDKLSLDVESDDGLGLTPTVTVPNVELARAGDWNAVIGGKIPLTADDFTDAIAAAADGENDDRPLRIGHMDARFGDGSPALGWVNPTRVVERDGVPTLLGDLVDVPIKLASMLRSAYRKRSIEALRNYTSPSGKQYRLVLTGLALLGKNAPAIKGLRDVMALYGDAEEFINANGDMVQLASNVTIEQLATAAQGKGTGVKPDKAKAQPKNSQFEELHPRGAGGLFAQSGAGGANAGTGESDSHVTQDHVKAIQKLVGATADGNFGPKTAAAVATYQRAHGLQVDGVVGSQTLATLLGHKPTATGSVDPKDLNRLLNGDKAPTGSKPKKMAAGEGTPVELIVADDEPHTGGDIMPNLSRERLESLVDKATADFRSSLLADLTADPAPAAPAAPAPAPAAPAATYPAEREPGRPAPAEPVGPQPATEQPPAPADPAKRGVEHPEGGEVKPEDATVTPITQATAPAIAQPIAAGGAPAQLPPGVVMLSESQVQDWERRLTAADTLVSQTAKQRREGLVDAAIVDGRIAMSDKDDWLGWLGTDENAYAPVLAKLRPNTLPTAPVGHGQPVAAGAGTPTESALPGVPQEAWDTWADGTFTDYKAPQPAPAS